MIAKDTGVFCKLNTYIALNKVFGRDLTAFHFCTIALTVALMISRNMLHVDKESRDTQDMYL